MRKYLFKKDKDVILSTFHIILTSLLLIAFDFYKGELLNVVLEGRKKAFVYFSLFFISLILVKCLSFYFYSFHFHRFKNKQLAQMREAFFKSLSFRPYPSFLRKSQGEYTNLYTNQFKVIEDLMFGGWYGFQQIIYETLFVFLVLVYIDLKLSLLVVLLCLPSILIPKLSEHFIQKQVEKKIQAENHLLESFKDASKAFELIKNFNIAPQVQTVFSKKTKKLKTRSFFLELSSSSINSLASASSHLSLVLVILYCSYLLAQGRLNVGLLVSSIGLMQRMQMNMNLITPYLNAYQRLQGPFTNIEKEINYRPDQPGPQKALSGPVQSILFDQVGFSYDSQGPQLIQNFNLQARDKGIYLFTGESGSGKSTSMNLLLNYFPLQEGRILINGQDHDQINNIYDFTKIMRQEVSLFNDSIENNISLYGPAEGLEELLVSLGLEKFANSPALKKQIKHGGSNLSGGEAKRINLARCLLRPAEILILDEPFANVDEKTIQLISQAILNIKDSYIFIISHQVPEEIEKKALARLEFPY